MVRAGKALGRTKTFRSSLPTPADLRYVDTPHGRTHVLVAGPEGAATRLHARRQLATRVHVFLTAPNRDPETRC